MTYDIHRTWEENAARGPTLPPLSAGAALPEVPGKTLLGLPVRSRIGIAAGLLLNSRWLAPYAQRGFDLLTYKTVRSSARPCYPLPNWVFVEDDGAPEGPVYVIDQPTGDPDRLSSAVCFGMPSLAPDAWRADVRTARSALAPGQILIVSVVGTPGESPRLDALAEDFARCAGWAAAAGAHVIEANLSCPNVCSAEGTLYLDPVASREVVQATRAAIGRTPLLLKVGHFPDPASLRAFAHAIAGLASGITLVNGISRPVLRRDGTPAFGPDFRVAGVLGRAIHEPSVAAVRDLRALIRSEGLPLELAAVGGASTVADFADFFDAGADAVLCGSSPMYLPDLALEVRRARPDW